MNQFYYSQPTPTLDRKITNKPEDLARRLDSKLEDLVSEESMVNVEFLNQQNYQIDQQIEQLQAKIRLLEEQKDLNNYYKFQICDHHWVSDAYEAGDRRHRSCEKCLLSQSSRYLYKK